MPEQKSSSFSLFLIVAVLAAWFLASAFYIGDLFAALPADGVADLSKTLIQTVGILVGLLAASGFFYLGKLEEQFTLAFSAANDYILRLARIVSKQKETAKMFRLGRKKWSNYCEKCKESEECVLKEDLLEILRESEGIEDKTLKAFTDQETSSKKFPAVVEEVSSKLTVQIMIVLGLTISLFFASIIFAVVAYLSKDHFFLQYSVNFIFSGMVMIFETMYFYHRGSRALRSLFQTISNANIEASAFELKNIRSEKAIFDDLQALEKGCIFSKR